MDVRPTRIILFDIDGTLLLTSGAGRRALEEAFSNFLPDPHALREIPVAGRTDRAILLDIFSRHLGRRPTQEEFDDATERYAECFERSLRDGAQVELMPGIPELLRSLSQRNDVLLGLGTGNMERTGRLKLRYAGLDRYFSFGGFAEDTGPEGHRHLLLKRAAKRGRSRLPHSNTRHSVLVIGDTVLDVEAAQSVGFPVLAVATGPDSVESLRDAGADIVLKTLERVEEVEQAIIEQRPSHHEPETERPPLAPER